MCLFLAFSPPLIKLRLSKLNGPVITDFGSNAAHNRKGCTAALGFVVLDLDGPCFSFGRNCGLLLVPGLGCTDNDDLVNVDSFHVLEPWTSLDRLGVASHSIQGSQCVTAEGELA